MRRSTTLLLTAVLILSLVGPSCAVNPATGKYQVSLIGEGQERQMGKAYDQQIVATYGLHGGQALQDYVQDLGSRLAAVSERPDLDWTFRVLDDPQVNAFALPGGYIYVTRGILAHMNSEAELAAVLGHEIGHVTARHSVNQMSKQQIAQLGLGLGSMVNSKWAGVATDLAGTAAGLLFLKYSRDDEKQADGLGWRYLMAVGYDPRPMPDVFETLRRVGEAAGAGGTPGWLSTHPDPADRRDRFARKIAKTEQSLDGRRVARDEFLQQIDGITFGTDPRQGYFKEARFFHPEMRFVLDFPDGWKTQNARDSVTALSQGQDGMVQLRMAGEASAAEALNAFFAQDGIQAGTNWVNRVNGFTAASRGFRAATQQGTIEGVVLFVEDGDRVLGLVGMAPDAKWSGHESAIRNSLKSFRRLTDRSAIDVQPKTLGIVRPGTTLSLQSFADRYGATVDNGTLALINRLDADARLAAGTSYKVVQGGRLP